MPKVVIYTDGGARGNPGPAGAGAVMYDEYGVVLKEVSDYLGETTNNVAEYEALIRILAAAHEHFGHQLSQISVEIRMDSELIVRQMEGKYKVKAPGLRPRFTEVKRLLQHFPHHSFTHVPREENTEADRLVNEAIDRGAV
ncbi:MAG TPA: ribonuclease HI family protein [Candidatus Paceibacterota bacterium]|nr:ribonuclease HI family protein [Candidatus Paceibacterota bacterium]